MTGLCDECGHRRDRLIPVAYTPIGGFCWVCPTCWRELDYPPFHWHGDSTLAAVAIRLRQEPVLFSPVK